MRKLVKKSLNHLGLKVARLDNSRSLLDINDSGYSRRCSENEKNLRSSGTTWAHYGCGSRRFGKGWVNIDLQREEEKQKGLYMRADLSSRHPFPSDYFQFGFAEDFIEHLTQDESLIFLSEIFRCLKSDGVLRLASPDLKDVLRRHFNQSNYEGALKGQRLAYDHWAHKHFYCRESITLVAKHIGFSKVEFHEMGKSPYHELTGLEHRSDQEDLNLHVELTK